MKIGRSVEQWSKKSLKTSDTCTETPYQNSSLPASGALHATDAGGGEDWPENHSVGGGSGSENHLLTSDAPAFNGFSPEDGNGTQGASDANADTPEQLGFTLSDIYREGYRMGRCSGEWDAANHANYASSYDDSYDYGGAWKENYQAGYEAGYNDGYWAVFSGDSLYI